MLPHKPSVLISRLKLKKRMIQTHPTESCSEPVDLPKAPFEQGYVQVYTGNGKGKTTAAIGLALRALGAGLPVFIGQFIKQGAYSEIKALGLLGDRVECRQFGRGCWLRGKPKEEDKRLAQQALKTVHWVFAENCYKVVILDEIITAQYFGLITVDDLLDLINRRPKSVELVLTGRYAPQEIIEAADLVSEMREIKHYYSAGVMARKGIES
jgi:cob(I)alamin adenosyltransferase